MNTTLKRIDVGSAFRVGIVLYGLMFAVFGLLITVFQGLLLSGVSSLMRSYDGNVPYSNSSTILGAGVLSLLCFYGVGIVVAAIGGGISFAIGALFYNFAANWVGGVEIQLESSDTGLLDDIERDMSKRKRDET